MSALGRRASQMANGYAHLGNSRKRPRYNFGRKVKSVAESIAEARRQAARLAQISKKK